MSDYQKRTPERLIEILRSSDQNPRSWNQEAADEIASLRAQLFAAQQALLTEGVSADNLRKALEEIATGKEFRAIGLQRIAQAALSDDYRTEASASTSAPDLSDGSARRGPAAGDDQHVAAVGEARMGPATATNSLKTEQGEQ